MQPSDCEAQDRAGRLGSMLPRQPDEGIDASMGRPAAGCTWALIPVIGTPRRCVAIHTDQIVYRSDLMS